MMMKKLIVLLSVENLLMQSMVPFARAQEIAIEERD